MMPVPGPSPDPAAPPAPAPPAPAPPDVNVPAAPPAPPDVAGVAVPAASEPPKPAERALGVGDVVEHTYFDAYSGAGGQEVTVAGLVIELPEPQGDETPVAVVAWFDHVSPSVPRAELRAR